MKVKTYIGLLSVGSLGGAFFIGIFGWWMLASNAKSNRELKEESRNTGASSAEYRDVLAFLNLSRGVFETMEIYPENYSGVYGVARDRISAAKDGIRVILEHHQNHYPAKIMQPIQSKLEELEKTIFNMEQIFAQDNKLSLKIRNKSILNYDSARKNLSADLDFLESKARTSLQESQQAIAKKWLVMEEERSTRYLLFFVASGIYFCLVISLSIMTYKSFASPIRKLEKAAKNSIDHQKPFNLKESGPYEIRSVTKRLQGLIMGLEDTVQKRTAALQKSNLQLKEEMKQRQELETQLVHAQKMEAVGQLASGIAHEINSPSQFANDNILFLKGATDGFIKRLNNAPDAPGDEDIDFFKENAPEAVEQAAEGISRITTIVKSMKNFAYRDAESAKRPNDLNQAIRSTVVVATNEWKYHAELDLRLQENMPMVPCNIGEINQVVLNLIVNGAHAIRDRMEEGQKGTIIVTTQHYPDAHCVVIAIADNGGGIPANVQTRIFEPFFTTKEVGVGTGQGLAIAHNVIVKSHKGQIWFESKEGIGTTFFIKLPMDQSEEKA
jgi:signal transduction histidine kinase